MALASSSKSNEMEHLERILDVLVDGVEPDKPGSSSNFNHSIDSVTALRERSAYTSVHRDGNVTSPRNKSVAQHTLHNFSKTILVPDQKAKIARALKHASGSEVENCFAAVKANLVNFSRHPSANYAMQMLFKVASEEMLADALQVLFDPQSLAESCIHENANFVIQTYLEVAPTTLCLDAVERIFSSPESLILIGNDRVGNNTIQAALRVCLNANPEGRRLCDCLANPFVLKSLARHKHGMHCIRCLLLQSPPSQKLRSAFWDSWLELSNNSSGNLCVSAFLVSCPAEDMSRHVHVLAENILNLSTHNYANHVVQTWIDQFSKLSEKADEHKAGSFVKSSIDTIIRGIQNSLFELAMDKHGAFVVCAALRAYKENQKCAPLVEALCKGSEMLQIARTQYGCQLLQKWSEIASKEQLTKMSAALSRNFVAASKDKFGNHFVLKMITNISPVGIFNTSAKINDQDTEKTTAAADGSMIEHTPHLLDSEGLIQLCNNFAELSEHQHASHVVQRVFKASVWWQLTTGTQIKMTEVLRANLSRLCHHKLGVHVARKAFTTIFCATKVGVYLSRPQELLLSALKENFQSIAKDQHGCRMIAVAIGCHHDDVTEICVMQACANIQSLSRATFGAVAVKSIITDCYYSRDGGTKSMLLKLCNAMSTCAVAMAKDRHGNIILQAAIRCAANQRITKEKVIGNDLLSDSMDDSKTKRKVAHSSVPLSKAEKSQSQKDCIQQMSSTYGAYNPLQHRNHTFAPCHQLILSLIPYVVPLSLDWFGNRVIQTLIECLPHFGCHVDLYHSIKENLMSHRAELERNKYATFVLRKLDEVEEARKRAWQANQFQEMGFLHAHITPALACNHIHAGSFDADTFASPTKGMTAANQQVHDFSIGDRLHTQQHTPTTIGGTSSYSTATLSGENRQHAKAQENELFQALPSQLLRDDSTGRTTNSTVSVEGTHNSSSPDCVVAQSETNFLQDRMWPNLTEPFVHYQQSSMVNFPQNHRLHSHMLSTSTQLYSLSAPAWDSETTMASPESFVHTIDKETFQNIS